MPGDVWDIAQGADGWMWFATSTGLYRFDGVQFEHIHQLGGKPLLSNILASVRTFADGSLWIGYRLGGLSVYRQGQLHTFAKAEGFEATGVTDIVKDFDGSMWVSSAGGIFHQVDNLWHRIGTESGLPGLGRGIMIDGAGHVWAQNEKQLLLWNRKRQQFVAARVDVENVGFQVDPHGKLWLTGRQTIMPGAFALRDDPVSLLAATEPPTSVNAQLVHDLIFDRDGSLWSTGCDGLCHILAADIPRAGAFDASAVARDKLDQAWQLSSTSTMVVMEDREGDVMVGTRRGIDKFRANRFHNQSGLGRAANFTLVMDAKGELWLASRLSKRGTLWHLTDQGFEKAPDLKDEVYSIAKAIDGTLLIGNGKFLERRSASGIVQIPFPADFPAGHPDSGARVIVDDGESIWVTFAFGKLYRYQAGSWTRAAQLGLPNSAPVVAGLGVGNAMWFGFRNNEVASIRGTSIARYTTADGLDIGSASAMFAADGIELVAGEAGLTMLVDRHFVRLKCAIPDWLVGITGILRTDDGDLWLNGSKGLVHVRAADWRDVIASGGTRELRGEIFDALDGYPGTAYFRAGQSSILQDKLGRIWITATAGVAWLDPNRLDRNKVAPSVEVVKLDAGATSYANPGHVALPAGTENLQIAYTALSFRMPERVRFRYMLDGVDKDWRDVGTRRIAYYTRLSPGDYHFRVIAANEDGVWSQTPAIIYFHIAPTFLQSSWFKAICALALLLLVWLLYRLRVQQVTGRLRSSMQARNRERERIARALHDTILQSNQALLLMVYRVRDRLPEGNVEASMLDTALEQAQHTLNEGRDEVSALRGSLSNTDLSSELCFLGQRLGKQAHIRFECDIGEPGHRLRSDRMKEVRFIAGEALENAFHHAQASAVVLTIAYGDDQFLVQVVDNGVGMPNSPAVKGKPGHWGLTGMRERALLIAADLTIEPHDGGGTKVTMTLAAKDAYLRPGKRTWLTQLLARHFPRGSDEDD